MTGAEFVGVLIAKFHKLHRHDVGRNDFVLVDGYAV